MERIKAIILSNEVLDDHNLWVKACEEYKEQLEYEIVDLTKNNWLDKLQSYNFDILLSKPSGLTAPFKQLYDERIYILNKVLKYPVFPTAEEIFIYENKRFLSFWLKANKIPHPQTDVFYNQKDATEFANNINYPIVGKVNIGSSGSGVWVLNCKQEAVNYIDQTFYGKGAQNRSGPNFSKRGIFKRGLRYLIYPGDITKKLWLYGTISCDRQRNFVIFQEFIPHNFEWRVVRIGDSFFAHKKLKIGDKASGSSLKAYESPPFELLDFVKEITDNHQFFSQAIDIFESENGYLVNEMQCIFGQSDPYQMIVDDKPGRFVNAKSKWSFQTGNYNTNQCFNLRVEHIINTFKSAKENR